MGTIEQAWDALDVLDGKITSFRDDMVTWQHLNDDDATAIMDGIGAIRHAAQRVRDAFPSPDSFQTVGDRLIVNPRRKIEDMPWGGEIMLSMETCGCGWSMARSGVGYMTLNGWACKRCGQVHTIDREIPEEMPAHLTRPDPERVKEFDHGVAGLLPAGTLTADEIERVQADGL